LRKSVVSYDIKGVSRAGAWYGVIISFPRIRAVGMVAGVLVEVQTARKPEKELKLG